MLIAGVWKADDTISAEHSCTGQCTWAQIASNLQWTRTESIFLDAAQTQKQKTQAKKGPQAAIGLDAGIAEKEATRKGA